MKQTGETVYTLVHGQQLEAGRAHRREAIARARREHVARLVAQSLRAQLGAECVRPEFARVVQIDAAENTQFGGGQTARELFEELEVFEFEVFDERCLVARGPLEVNVG